MAESNAAAERCSEIVAAYREQTGAVNEALAEALGIAVEATFGEVQPWDDAQHAEAIQGPGLAIALPTDLGGWVLLVPESGRLLPDGYADPGPGQQERLQALATRLGQIGAGATPQQAAQVWAGRVERLDEALRRSAPAPDAQVVVCRLAHDAQPTSALLVCPVAYPNKLPDAGAKPASQTDPASTATSAQLRGVESPKPHDGRPAAEIDGDLGLSRLPIYARSLLRIQVPVSVRLASKRQKIGQVVQLCPGSIISFDKTCDEMLDLLAGGCRVGLGEAVKVGDKFGLRILSISMPHERFGRVLQPRRVAEPHGRTVAQKQADPNTS